MALSDSAFLLIARKGAHGEEDKLELLTQSDVNRAIEHFRIDGFTHWRLFGRRPTPGADRPLVRAWDDTDGSRDYGFTFEQQLAMMVKRVCTPGVPALVLVCEVKGAHSIEEARLRLDAFREAVLPSENYGITLYQVPVREDA